MTFCLSSKNVRLDVNLETAREVTPVCPQRYFMKVMLISIYVYFTCKHRLNECIHYHRSCIGCCHIKCFM
uniref:Uncharacterized protein n=1 Tax=Octopus bimaculoides TaxID=37653 RepID=A0A0L8G3I9_OCTBM